MTNDNNITKPQPKEIKVVKLTDDVGSLENSYSNEVEFLTRGHPLRKIIAGSSDKRLEKATEYNDDRHLFKPIKEPASKLNSLPFRLSMKTSKAPPQIQKLFLPSLNLNSQGSDCSQDEYTTDSSKECYRTTPDSFAKNCERLGTEVSDANWCETVEISYDYANLKTPSPY